MNSIRSKLSNFWYHYKVPVLFFGFVIFACLFCLHSCFSKEKYDLEVYYFTGTTPVYKEHVEWLQNALCDVCPDFNHDGKVSVAVTNVHVGARFASERSEYMTAVQSGNVNLFFCDKEGLDYLNNSGYIQTNDANPSVFICTDSAWWTNYSGFDLFNTETTIALRVFEGTWASKRSAAKKSYEQAAEVYNILLNY